MEIKRQSKNVVFLNPLCAMKFLRKSIRKQCKSWQSSLEEYEMRLKEIKFK